MTRRSSFQELQARVTQVEATIPSLHDGTIPVELRGIAQRLGVESITYKPLPVEAMLLPSSSNSAIVINSQRPRTRQRFSLAHEIGHLLLEPDAGKEEHFRSPPVQCADRQLERACDRIASEILMPTEQFTKCASAAGWSADSVPTMSKIFETSYETTAIRLVDLAPEPCALIVWQAGDSVELKLKWSHCNQTFNARAVGFIPKSGLHNHASLCEAYGSNHLVSGVEEFAILPRRITKNQPYHRCRVKCESVVLGQGNFKRGFTLLFPNRV